MTADSLRSLGMTASARLVRAAPQPRSPAASHHRVSPTTPVNNPSSFRRHHAPVRRFVSRSVNQYCHFTARTNDGGALGNGLFRNRCSTLGLFSSRRCCASTTQLDCSHGPSDANQRFHSNLG